MPTYDFYCPRCDKTHEIMLTIKEATSTPIQCRKCGDLMERRYSDSFGVIVAPPEPKLTAWHRTRKYR